MGYRINERNSGSWSIEGEPKKRKSSKKLTDSDKSLIGYILEEVVPKLGYDKIMSKDKGQHNPDAWFTGVEDIVIAVSRKDFDQLSDIIEKLK